MSSRTITVIFWNVWERSQNGIHGDSTKLCNRLDDLIEQYNPDVFGFNEILVNRDTGSSPVLDHLKQQGYQIHFAPCSPMSSKWMIGNAFVSKQKPLKTIEHILGKDTQASRQRGYKGHYVKAIEAHVKVGDETISIIVNYLSSLLPLDWATHIKHRRAFEGILKTLEHKSVIAGGDFNETKYMLPWLRLPKHLKRKTGTLHNPTWRLNGQKRQVAFANYDNLVYSVDSVLRLRTFKVLPRQPSDHSPLLGVFEAR